MTTALINTIHMINEKTNDRLCGASSGLRIVSYCIIQRVSNTTITTIIKTSRVYQFLQNTYTQLLYIPCKSSTSETCQSVYSCMYLLPPINQPGCMLHEMTDSSICLLETWVVTAPCLFSTVSVYGATIQIVLHGLERLNLTTAIDNR